MWVEGTLDKVVITIDGEDRVLLPYAEAWVQEGPKPFLHPLACSIMWVLIQGVTSEKVPSSSESLMHRVLTALQIGFSYSYNVPQERLQEALDRLLAENKETEGEES
jgi:hypothetical protein